jgi:GAF domain-containing protein
MFPRGTNEEQRLQQLRALEIVDTPESHSFNRICALAQEYFRVPIVFISFVDEDRQWFKARCGISASGSSREAALCNYTILQDDLFIVQDTHADTRFSQNPLVTGEPFIRFYAGAPIVFAPGVRVGSVCIVDRVPRTLNGNQRAFLKHLAEITVTELRLVQAGKAYFRREFSRAG